MQEFRHPGGGILFQLGSLALREVAQHSVQPTSGIRRVFWQVSEPWRDSVFAPCPRPAHLRLTQAVGRLKAITVTILDS